MHPVADRGQPQVALPEENKRHHQQERGWPGIKIMHVATGRVQAEDNRCCDAAGNPKG